jgi:hypothetical protein
MTDPIIIPINKKKLGAVAWAAFCIALGFIPFAFGAALLLPVGGLRSLDMLLGSYAFFLCAAFFIAAGFMKDHADD